MRRHALAATLLVAALVPVPLASAQDYTPGAAVFASPAVSPLPDPCPAQPETPGATNFENTEVEPQIAVNPTDQNNVIAVFQEDRWSNGGAHGLVAGISMNGGASYTNNWAEFSACSGDEEPLPRATDPWVSFDKDGRAYQIALPIVDADGGDTAVTAAYSTNKGVTWSDPVDIIRDSDPLAIETNDKQSITADPYTAGTAYATWIRGTLPGAETNISKLQHAFSFRGQPMFSKTTNGGVSWSTPKPMTNANVFAQGNQIVVLPDRSLVNVQAVLFKGSGVQPTSNAFFEGATRSNDGGRHWSPTTRISPLGFVQSSADGKDLRVGDYLPDIAVDRESGDLYVTWADPQGGPTEKIVLSRSTDGGKTWSTPVTVSHHNAAHSFNHAVAVANDGEVAVLYYDIARNDSNPGIPTDVYLRHSGNGGVTWSAPQLLYSFDFANAPNARGLFLGDYMGLEARGDNDLIALFSVTDGSANSANVISMQLNR